jgi:pyridoxine kinase
MKPWLWDMTPRHIRSATSDREQSLLCLASVCAADADDNATSRSRTLPVVYAGCIPFIPMYFVGVGDLFSALVLGHYSTDVRQHSHLPTPPLEDGRGASQVSSLSCLPPLPRAVSLALTKTHTILRLTEKHASSLPSEERTTTDDEMDKKDPERLIRRMRGRELRLVQGRKVLTGEAMGEMRLLQEWGDFWGPN